MGGPIDFILSLLGGRLIMVVIVAIILFMLVLGTFVCVGRVALLAVEATIKYGFNYIEICRFYKKKVWVGGF